MRRTILLLATMVPTLLVASGLALAVAGDLDPSFGEGGEGKVDLRAPLGVADAEAVAVHPDGGLVVVGPRHGAGSFVVRLDSAGNLDGSFGGGDGVVSGEVGDRLYYSDVVVRPDGKIVVAGTAGIYRSKVALDRYNPNGTLDKSFGGGDGKVITDTPGNASILALLRQPDGRLVVAGRVERPNVVATSDFLLVRYRADGRRDKSFGGGDGIAITRVAGNAYANDLVVRSDGKLVAAGLAYRSGHGRDIALVRYNPNGTLDGSFGGGDGTNYTDLGSNESVSVLVRQNGALVTAGRQYGRGSDPGFFLVRFASDGRLDQNFGGGDGKVSTDVIPGGGSSAYALVVQADGKLVAAGTAHAGVDYKSADFALVRYYPGGRLDASFGGGDGKVLTDFGRADVAFGLALQPNGKIVAAGRSGEYVEGDKGDELNPYVAVSRYLAE